MSEKTKEKENNDESYKKTKDDFSHKFSVVMDITSAFLKSIVPHGYDFIVKIKEAKKDSKKKNPDYIFT